MMTIPTYDYDQRHWKKIYGPEELNKIGELLTVIPASEIISTKDKTYCKDKGPYLFSIIIKTTGLIKY